MKLNMFVPLLVLLLLGFGVSNNRCSTIFDNSTDILSLLNFKQAINGPAETFSNWDTSTRICQWKGVTCNPKNRGRVTVLNLAGRGLSGPITASIGNLTFLHTLNLSSNQFSGQIPDALTNCSKLRQVDISANKLDGTIPPKIGHLSNLEFLFLFRNNLSGSIPPTIRNCTHLNQLKLGGNNLEGSIPDDLGQLKNLTVLALGGNRLYGGIPMALLNLHSLNALDLGTNKLVKEVPSNIGDALPNLNFLYLGGNMFEGQIPASLGKALRLQKIDLSRNNFTGPIPTSFGNLSDLAFLNLDYNKLEAWDTQGWEFLSTLSNCNNLQLLSLSYNRLRGIVPNSIGNLSANLQNLLLTGNDLSGVVPPSIRNLTELNKLILVNNNFTGTIEEWIGSMKKLQVLHLQNNSFVGPVPSDLGNLTQLLSLYLAENSFEGVIPPDLGKLQQIEELDLSYNNLSGNIPNEAMSSAKLRLCVLSYNNLEGPIPLDLSKLTQLTQLQLSSNKLTGQIPGSLGQCQYLETIEMDQNGFTGNIPVSFSKLVSLSVLNLSHNYLSGTIPKELSVLRYLTNLDISYNHFVGEVPRNGVFANVTAVSLEGNWGLCGGMMDLNMPPCPTISKKGQRQYYLIRVLIPIFGFLSIILLAYFLLLKGKTRRRKYISLPSFGKQFPRVTYNDLAEATENFSDSYLVARGSYRSVYRGKLKEPDMEVAVKVFDLEMRGAERSFLSECEALRSIQHRNLLPIKTACSPVDNKGNAFKALVYEFMPNGSLDTWLHNKDDGNAPKRLGLAQRINIIVNTADALDYLHNDCGRPTIHCDLKPSNILLDDDMNALLGDFGIASFYVDSQLASTVSSNSIGVKGTIGYIPPEYAGGGRGASTSGDVYSFGILILQMLTGKRPTDPMFKDGLNIVNFVENNFPHQISHVIDAQLVEECKEFTEATTASENDFYHCLVSLLQIALSCTRPLPNERRNMKEITSKLHAIKASYLG